MLPYLWEFRGRAAAALACLVLAKVANVGVPLVLKGIVDALDGTKGQVLVLPFSLLLAYGALKLGSALFNELRDVVFARVRYRAMRRLSTQVLSHLHALSLRYHLDRRSGGVSRDLERGTRSVSTILNYTAFSVLPVTGRVQPGGGDPARTLLPRSSPSSPSVPWRSMSASRSPLPNGA